MGETIRRGVHAAPPAGRRWTVPASLAREAAEADKRRAPAAMADVPGWNDQPASVSDSLSARRYNPLSKPAAAALAVAAAAAALCMVEPLRPLAAAAGIAGAALGAWALHVLDERTQHGGQYARAGIALSAAAAILASVLLAASAVQPQAAAADDWGTDTDVVGNVTHTRTQTSAEKYGAREENLGLAIGQTAVMDTLFADNLEVAVTDAGAGPVAKDGSPLVGVDIRYSNNDSSEDELAGQYQWKAKDADGNIISPVSAGNLRYNADYDRLIPPREVGPGDTLEGTIYFPAKKIAAVAFYGWNMDSDPTATWIIG